MNNRTDAFRGEMLGALLTLALGATGALAAAEAAKPAVAAAVPAVEAVQPAKGEDVISLDDLLDDSADAAKKAPTIRVASRPKAPTEAAVKPIEAQPSATNDAAVAQAPETASPAATNDAAIAQAPEAAKPGKLSAAQGLFATPLAQDESTLIDISCDDATLADVLRQFRRTTGANIISVNSSNLNQRVSATLNHVPWMAALQAILNAQKFRLEPRGGIYFVSEDKQAVPEFTRSFVLNHASATELADLFNTTLGGMPVDPKTGKPVSSMNGKASGKRIATAFDGANVVVVTATEKILADCETIIKAVDKAIPQIYIEARFIEISNEALHKLGMQWNQLESWGASVKGMTGGMEYNNGRANVYDYRTRTGSSSSTVSSSSDGTTATASRSSSSSKGTARGSLVADSIAAASGAGRTAENMNWLNARGFSGQLSADDFSLALSAFESMTDAKIFSNPKVIVSNGKEAKVDMTTKFPHVKVTSQRNTSTTQSYVDMATEMQVIPGEDKMMFAKEAFFSWGITLSVKPRISPDGLISVEIVPTISQLDTDVTDTGFYEIASDSGTGRYPIIKMKRLITDFTMKDGATAVIGGLSKTEEEDVDSGIPYLRKIPYVGPKLFGWKSRGKVQKEVIVFVTLGIADPSDLPKDIGLPQNAVAGREYVNGTKFEPGQREGGVAGLMKFDTRSLEDQRKDDSRAVKIEASPSTEKTGSGNVEIRIVKPAETPARADALK